MEGLTMNDSMQKIFDALNQFRKAVIEATGSNNPIIDIKCHPAFTSWLRKNAPPESRFTLDRDMASPSTIKLQDVIFSTHNRTERFVYLLTMNRWGSNENHSYSCGIYSNIKDCLSQALIHTDMRGGKYEPEITMMEVDGRTHNFIIRSTPQLKYICEQINLDFPEDYKRKMEEE